MRGKKGVKEKYEKRFSKCNTLNALVHRKLRGGVEASQIFVLLKGGTQKYLVKQVWVLDFF